jgi:hypothetical protein
LHEDAKLLIHHGGGEKRNYPPVPVYKFDKEYYDKIKAENFGRLTAYGQRKVLPISILKLKNLLQDIDWMPKVVMIAKNAFVWLHQLSKNTGGKLKQLIRYLMRNLICFSKWKFTSLWLIGIWERSSASQKIKQFYRKS